MYLHTCKHRQQLAENGPDKKYKLFYTENPICYEMVMKKNFKYLTKIFYIGNPIWYETDNKYINK